MYAAKGVGLAAPQIGISRKRIAVIDTSTGEDPAQKLVLINPEIVATEGTQESEEGCLSIPGFREQVARAAKVTVRAQNAKGEDFEMTGEDLLARAFLHETDHLNGRLYISHISALKRDLIRRKIRKLQKAGEWRLSAVHAPGLPGHARVRRPHAGSASSRPGTRCVAVVHAAGPAQGPRPASCAASPVKEAALRLGLAVLPAGARPPPGGRRRNCAALAPDAMVVVGYGQIIPQAIIDLAAATASSTCTRRCCRSIAARRRSSGPSRAARRVTGVTTMRIDAGLDTGDMLLKAETANRSGGDRRRTGPRAWRAMGAELAGRDARRPRRRHRRPAPQDDVAGHPRADSQEGRRPDRLDASRAADPQPRARLSALARRVHDVSRPDAVTSGSRARLRAETGLPARPAASCRHKRLFAGCGDGTALELLEVQLEGTQAHAGAPLSSTASASGRQ